MTRIVEVDLIPGLPNLHTAVWLLVASGFFWWVGNTLWSQFKVKR